MGSSLCRIFCCGAGTDGYQRFDRECGVEVKYNWKALGITPSQGMIVVGKVKMPVRTQSFCSVDHPRMIRRTSSLPLIHRG